MATSLEKKFDVKSFDDWAIPALWLLEKLSPGDRVWLQGELGSGKSTFVRSLLHEAGYDGEVPSPTYSIVLEHWVGDQRVVHIDGFRMESFKAENRLWDETDWKKAWVFVEWPEKTGLNPKSFRWRALCEAPNENSRTITLISTDF